MKLTNLYEQEDPFGNWLKEKMMRRITKGGSRLKEALTGEGYNLDHVRLAIEKSICFKNLGPTYLEQTVSNLLRDMVQNGELKLAQMNDARNYFHLDRMTPKQLSQEKSRKAGV